MIHFKTASIKDAKILADLVNSAYRGESSVVGWTTEAHLLDGQRTDGESLTEVITMPGNQIEMAFDSNEKLVGCVHLKFENSDSLYFGMLTILPTAQGTGLGKKLISHIEDIAREKKISTLKISVIQLRLELIEFYERRGFKSTGNFQPFPDNDPRFGIPKVSGMLLLEFVKQL